MNNKREKFNLIFYFFDCSIWTLATWFWYKLLLFRCIGTLSLLSSVSICLGLVLGCAVIGAVIDRVEGYNWKNIVLNLITAYGIYTMLAYFHLRKTPFLIIVSVTIVVSLVYLLLFILCNLKSFRLNSRYLLRYSSGALRGIRQVTGMGMIVIMIPLVIHQFPGFSMLVSKEKPVTEYEIGDQTISKNIEKLTSLYEETWKELSVDERLEVLQTVADIERRYLGIPHELLVGANNPNNSERGGYYDTSHEIVLNLDYLSSCTAQEAVTTVAHECFHAYQHRIIDAYDELDDDLKGLYIFDDAVIYKEEFLNYIDSEKDPIGYWNMSCEMDCRKYGEDAAEEYLDRVYEYLGITREGIHYYEGEIPEVKSGDSGQQYLIDRSGKILAGPYYFLEDGNFTWNHCYRYIGMNGLIGYLNKEGEEITPPMFVDGSEMFRGLAMVSETGDSVYYISSLGEKLTRDYVDGYPFDHDWQVARVKMDDGKWALIDDADNVLFTGADRIGEIPFESSFMGAIIDGKAAILELNDETELSCRVVGILDGYTDITMLSRGRYAVVTDSNGMMGIVDNTGKMIVEAKYVSIDHETMYNQDTYIGEIKFKMGLPEGGYEYTTLEFFSFF